MQAAFGNRALNKTKNEISKRAEKLASGYKINRSADDAAGLSISEKMRAQIRGLDQASRNIQDGVSLVDVADGALQETHNILQRQRELLVQAANDTNTAEDKEAIQKEITALTLEIDDIFEKTEFNGFKIFKGHIDYLEGPSYKFETNTKEEIINDTSTQKSEITWIPKNNPLPPPSTDVQVSDVTSTSSKHIIENEWVYDKDEMERESYAYENKDVETTIEQNTTTTINKTYQDLSSTVAAPYTNLANPAAGNVINNLGYLRFLNENGSLKLSCEVSSLSIMTYEYDTNGDISPTMITSNLHSNNRYGAITTRDAAQKTVTTKYQVNNEIVLTQKVVLDEVNNKYDITYTVENTSQNPQNIKVKFAFDALNTENGKITYVKKDDPSATYPIENDTAKIAMTTDPSNQYLEHSMYADINNLNGIQERNWDFDNINLKEGSPIPVESSGRGHTGVAYWWNGPNLAGGAKMEFSMSYGPIELKKKPIQETTETIVQGKIITTEKINKLEVKYKPTYLMIQSGANEKQAISIRQYYLNATGKPLSLEKINVSDTDHSLVFMDEAINKMSKIRSDYGAKRNRLEYAMAVDDNGAENTQAAESRIRDTDMAKEMIQYSKGNILQQASQAILVQANQSKQGVLNLLSGI